MKASGGQFSNLRPPSYARVYFDIATGYALLLLSLFLVMSDFYQTQAVPVKFCFLVSLCLFNGLLLHYLTLYTHAAGHWELAGNKAVNDRLGNALVGYIFLTSIPLYRKKHFGHHRLVGTDQDPEGSYSVAPNLANFMQVLMLLIPLKKLLGIWGKSVQKSNPGGQKDIVITVLAFGAIQSLILGFFFIHSLLVEWVFLWAIPLFSLMPLFSWIRTLCEHRPFDSPDNHAAIYRAFKSDTLGFFMGAAGFSDHDLHHRYPHLHYTQFKEFQKQSHGNFPSSRRHSYGATIWELFQKKGTA